jgi:hypothetical protein
MNCLIAKRSAMLARVLGLALTVLTMTGTMRSQPFKEETKYPNLILVGV